MKTNRMAAMGGVALVGAMVFGGAMMMGGGSVAAAPARGAEADAKTYAVDPVHTSVIFKIKHMGVSNFYGRFDDASGSFTLGDTASVEITVKTGSVDTNNSKRDSDVKGPDFLGAKEFPEIKFVGHDMKKTGDGVWKGKGDLSFHGATRPLEVEIKQTGTGKGGAKAGIETMFTIKRSDFGSKGMLGETGIGDEVTLWVASEGGAK